MKKKVVSAALVVASIGFGAQGQATVLFSDNFDSDRASYALNVPSLNNWTVSLGTVDYIRSGDFGISCVGSTGGCLDLDGSTRDAGRITSQQVFTFVTGVQYFIDLTLSGNQRGGSNDSVGVGLIQEGTGSILGTAFGPLAPSQSFGTYVATFYGVNTPGSWRLYVEGVGGDNIGAILDNYVLRDDRTETVPEPLTLALFGVGLAGIGYNRRKLNSRR